MSQVNYPAKSEAFGRIVDLTHEPLIPPFGPIKLTLARFLRMIYVDMLWNGVYVAACNSKRVDHE